MENETLLPKTVHQAFVTEVFTGSRDGTVVKALTSHQCDPSLIDLCHLAAMLSLRRIKSFVFAWLASHSTRIWGRLAMQTKVYSQVY